MDVDGGLEVDDHALAQALGLRLADADDVEAPLVGDLGHDRADLVGADVEADDVAVLLLRHALPHFRPRLGSGDGGGVTQQKLVFKLASFPKIWIDFLIATIDKLTRRFP